MTPLEKELIEAIKNDNAYDFIAQNYNRFSKEQLKDIILEYMFAVYEANKGTTETYEIESNVIEELTERWDY